MIKAVCFDFYNTLAYLDPPREKFYADIAAEFGVKVAPEAVADALSEADAFWRAENFKSPIREREQNDKYATYAKYGLQILKGANPPATPEQALQMLAKAFSIGFKFLPYADSLPTLKALKLKSLKIGVISNIGQEIDGYCAEMGFKPYLDFKVTSFEAGFDKPRPEIFQLALKKAAVLPEESIFVGDQYEQDIQGSRAMGMKPILLDRSCNSKICDCPVIHSLLDVADLV
jgi:putative hydrolase of the HAD superfamily